MTGVLAVAVGIVAGATGHLLYKAYFRDRHFLLLVLAAASFGLGQVGFFLALKSLRLGVVYMATGLIQVLVLWSSRVVLNETVSAHQAAAVGVIVVGVALYAL